MNIFEQAQEAARWWRELQPNPARSWPGGDRAALARLRRAATPLEAAEEPATIALVRRLGEGARLLEPVAVCAAVLAHIRADDQEYVARRIGVPRDPNRRARLSSLRFRRLVQAESAEDRLTQFRRLAALADQTLNVQDLAAALLDWSERRRRDWIFRYYDGEPPAAEPPTSAEGTAP